MTLSAAPTPVTAQNVANRRVPSRSSISEPNIQIASALKSRWNAPPWRKA